MLGRIGIRYCTIGLFQIVMLSSISASVWFEGSGVLRTKGLECGSNGRIILGGGAACEDALVRFTGLLTMCGGVVPTAV